MFISVHQVGLTAIITFILHDQRRGSLQPTKRPMTIFWSHAHRQHHVTICLMKFAVGKWNVAISYNFYVWSCNMNNVIIVGWHVSIILPCVCLSVDVRLLESWSMRPCWRWNTELHAKMWRASVMHIRSVCVEICFGRHFCHPFIVLFSDDNISCIVYFCLQCLGHACV